MIENSIHMKMRINGEDIKGARNLFVEIILQSGLDVPFPLARLTLQDMEGKLSGDLALVDGTKLQIEIGDSEDDFTTVNYIVLSKDSYDQDGINQQQVFCVIDLPNLIFESSFDVVNGTSIDTIKKIFSDANFDLETDLSTSDKQKWLNCGETKIDFLKRVNLHAYVDDKSCIMTAIDFDKAYCKDLFKVFDEDVFVNLAYQVLQGDETFILLADCTPKSRSGFLNATNNYGQYHQQHSLDGELLTMDKVNPTVKGNSGIPINIDVKGEIINALHTAGDFYDVGHGDLPGSNLHKFYYHAKYQNTRYASLFSETTECLSTVFLNPPLLTLANVQHGEIRDGEPVLDEIHSGDYLLAGKTLILRGTSYAEKYKYIRYFLTEEGNTSVVASPASSPAPVDSSADSSLEQSLREMGISNNTIDAPDVIPNGVIPEPSVPSIISVETIAKIDAKQVAEKSATGNKLPKVAATVLDKKEAAAKQVNANIKSNKDALQKNVDENTGKVQSAFDKAEEKFNKTADDLEKSFKDEAASLGSEELKDKYGESYDYLDATMDEFQSALDKIDLCKMLNELEALTLKIVLPKVPAFIDSLNNRIGKINTALGEMYDDIDALMENGDIDGDNLDLNKHKTECDSDRMDKLNTASVGDKLKPACLDDRDMGKLNLPILKLLKKNGDLENKLKDLLCALGSGDGDTIQEAIEKVESEI